MCSLYARSLNPVPTTGGGLIVTPHLVMVALCTTSAHTPLFVLGGGGWTEGATTSTEVNTDGLDGTN